METLTEYPLLKYRPDTLYNIRKMFNLEKPGRMQESIDILEEWIKKQEHFESKTFDRGYLEILIITCKGSIEKAKLKIDKLCTMRTLAPEFFGSELMQLKLNRCRCLYSLMPMLTPDYDKLFVTRLLSCDLNSEDLFNIFKDWIISTEFMLRRMYFVGFITIYDFRDANIQELIKAFNLSVARKYEIILQEGFGIRLKAVHFLSNSKLIETFLAFLKPILPAKIANRIHVHLTLESLHKMVPRELLCQDLGGDEASLVEMHEIGMQYVSSKEHIDYMKEVLKQKTDESKRIGGEIDVHFLPGTFRSLNVD